MIKFIRKFGADLATLRKPVTATAVVGLLISVVKPFGLNPDATEVAAILTAVGTAAAYLESRA